MLDKEVLRYSQDPRSSFDYARLIFDKIDRRLRTLGVDDELHMRVDFLLIRLAIVADVVSPYFRAVFRVCGHHAAGLGISSGIELHKSVHM